MKSYWLWAQLTTQVMWRHHKQIITIYICAYFLRVLCVISDNGSNLFAPICWNLRIWMHECKFEFYIMATERDQEGFISFLHIYPHYFHFSWKACTINGGSSKQMFRALNESLKVKLEKIRCRCLPGLYSPTLNEACGPKNKLLLLDLQIKPLKNFFSQYCLCPCLGKRQAWMLP